MPSAESAEGTAAEAGDEALEGEAQDIRDNLIAGGAEILAEYPLGVLSLSEAGARKLVAACAVGESSDGSVIAAFPGKCWNRAAAKRVIGLDLVRKVSTVRVKCADPENRGQALDSDLRICLGLLTTEGEAAFDFVRDFEEDIDIDYPFGPPDQPELLPHGEALAELAKNTFEFLTGESAPPENPTTSAGAGAQGVEERLGRLEGCFLSIQEDLKKLVGSRAESGTAPPHVEAGAPSSAPIRASAKRAPGPDLSGMDQSVVKAALDSGIEMKHIEEMGKFLRSQRPMEDEPRASAKPGLPAGPGRWKTTSTTRTQRTRTRRPSPRAPTRSTRRSRSSRPSQLNLRKARRRIQVWMHSSTDLVQQTARRPQPGAEKAQRRCEL